jgi:hypothetical protein
MESGDGLAHGRQRQGGSVRLLFASGNSLFSGLKAAFRKIFPEPPCNCPTVRYDWGMIRNGNTKGTTMNKLTKSQEISRRIFELIHTYQMPISKAFDAVCGEGAYDRLVGDLYNDLRKEAV